MGGVVGRAQQWWANTESRRIPGPEDGRGGPGERGEPHALNGICLASGAFGQHPSAQVENAPQRRPGVDRAKFEGDGPGQQVGVGALSVVDAGRDDPRVPAQMTGEGCTARPDVAVGQGEKSFVDTLVLDVEFLDDQGPTRLGGGLGKGPLAPPTQLVGQQLVQARRAPGERHHPGAWRTAVAVHQHDRGGPYVRDDHGSGAVGHARQPIHHHQDRLRVDAPPPELFQHAQCHVPGIHDGDLHRGALDHHSRIVEPGPASRIGGEVCDVRHARDAVGQQELLESRPCCSLCRVVDEFDADLGGASRTRKCRGCQSQSRQRLDEGSPGQIKAGEIHVALGLPQMPEP